jgi:hypothetical protein
LPPLQPKSTEATPEVGGLFHSCPYSLVVLAIAAFGLTLCFCLSASVTIFTLLTEIKSRPALRVNSYFFALSSDVRDIALSYRSRQIFEGVSVWDRNRSHG